MMTIETIGDERSTPSLVRTLVALFQRIRRNRKTRLHLSDLTDAALEDIGLTRREAEAEARRWIWR
jgi:uncharacterized protein YjiS (DUF1127 family)